MENPELAGPDNRLDPLFTAPNLEEPWFKSMVRGVRDMLNPPKLPPLEVTSKPVENVDMGGMSVVEQSWFKTFFTNVKEAIRPPKLPPLEVTSKPVQVGSIWGAYSGGESRSGALSVGIHIGVICLLLLLFQTPAVRRVVNNAVVLYDPIRLPPALVKPAGGGGGGMHMPKPVSKAEAPKPAIKQFVPPTPPVVKPKLPVAPTITAPAPEIKADTYADPLAKAMDFSGGQGSKGMGNGTNYGLGNGNGNGMGDGSGGGTGTGAYRIGGDVSAPQVVSKVEPEYSEEARKAKYSGSVLLSLIIDANGMPRDIKVIRPLGLGLDEKAIEAVSHWRFRPGMKGGRPVATQANIEVNFRLL
ncbi:MAG TPA: energy transducer TonB [Bryobacteraceae bacterium]|nr:energy transducer TonB [Bryobacteraceae bacterium]